MAKRNQPQDDTNKQLSIPGTPAGQVPVVIPQGSAELGEPSETEPMTDAEQQAAYEEAARRYYELFYAGHGTPPSNLPAAVDSEGQLIDQEGRGLDILAEDATIEETALPEEVPAADETREDNYVQEQEEGSQNG